MAEVGLAHRAGKGAAPVRLMEIDEHSVDNILGILIQYLGFSGRTSPGFEVCQYGEIAGKVISVPNPPACIDAESRAFLGEFQFPGIAIESRQIDHRLTHAPIEIVLQRNVARLFQIRHRSLSISLLKRELSEGEQDHG